ncbi:MAG: hypothetical protein RI572_02410 [Salegentibacter sp.]|uniref:Uncharacterized protein n=1 Tax=Salegentibacter flavus TaxID=287099 RepID=A0A1I4Z7W8_9FLAO|nr:MULTISPECIES: hypothetical protein [Salegentibacter]MDR9456239.1 hypothetical protein [Salegentibacter sp.]SFN46103.1 hypothetical protein SAMN05660413_01155 [Salegentibacter flavus]
MKFIEIKDLNDDTFYLNKAQIMYVAFQEDSGCHVGLSNGLQIKTNASYEELKDLVDD